MISWRLRKVGKAAILGQRLDSGPQQLAAGNMDPIRILTDALRAIDPGYWEADQFMEQKFFVAAAASLAAYAHPSEYELKHSSRAIVIPSKIFQKSTKAGVRLLTGAIPGAEARISFVETRYFVASFIKVGEVVIVAYRGTADLYDIFLDLSLKKEKLPSIHGIDLRVHTGFLKAFLEGFPCVNEELNNLKPFRLLVGSGHSLGGAMCSLHNAISNSLSNKITNPQSFLAGTSLAHAMKACITFGSPKVGNQAFAAFCEWGHHIIQSTDPVPMLPSSFMGYCRQPFAIHLDASTSHSADMKLRFLPFLRKKKLISFSSHKMEGYVEACASMAGVAVC